MLRHRRDMCVVVFAALAACVHPHPITDIGPERSLDPLDASVQKDFRGTIHVDVTTTQAAYITVLAVVRNEAATVLVQSPGTASVWLTPGKHRLVLQPIRRQSPQAARPDHRAELLASMGLSEGTFQPPYRSEGVGSLPLERCLDWSPSNPRLCPVLPTEPLVPSQRVPPARYLLFIATEKPLELDKVQEQLEGLNLSADGRELLTEVAYAAGLGVRWGAYGVRR